nr:MAG TPA: Baseplate component [Caudoviricetes sp.]
MNQQIVEAYVFRDDLKRTVYYTQGTDALPMLFLFKDYEIPEGTVVGVFVEKPSKKGVQSTSATLDVGENSVLVDMDKQMVAEIGTAYMQLRLTKGGKELFTFVQPIRVERSATPIDSENGMTFLDEVIAKMGEATEDMKATVEDAREAIAVMEEKAINGEFSASITVGKVINGEPGNVAKVTNSGTKKDAVFDFIIPTGPQGPSGVMAPSAGMYCLRLDPATGDLWVDYPDGTEPPAFRYDSETGNLYYEIEREDGTMASLLIGNVRNPLINNVTTATPGQGALDAAVGKDLKDEIDAIKETLKNVLATQ